MNRARLSVWFWSGLTAVGAVWSVVDIIGQCGGLPLPLHQGCTAQPGLAPAALTLIGMLMLMASMVAYGPRVD